MATLSAPPGAQRPIFIVGMPCSGTSRVTQILRRHPAVHALGEADLLRPAVLSQWRDGAPPSRAVLAGIAARYRAALAARSGAAVVIDEASLNFRWIGLIRHALPDAAIVHVRRRPAATCWSVFRRVFASSAHRYGYGLVDVAAYHRLHDALMALWVERWPDAVLTLGDERLTERPRTQVRALLEHCGLAWEPACLTAQHGCRAVQTVSAGQLRRPIHTASSEAWRRYEPWLGPMLEELAAPAERLTS